MSRFDNFVDRGITELDNQRVGLEAGRVEIERVTKERTDIEQALTDKEAELKDLSTGLSVAERSLDQKIGFLRGEVYRKYGPLVSDEDVEPCINTILQIEGVDPEEAERRAEILGQLAVPTFSEIPVLFSSGEPKTAIPFFKKIADTSALETSNARPGYLKLSQYGNEDVIFHRHSEKTGWHTQKNSSLEFCSKISSTQIEDDPEKIKDIKYGRYILVGQAAVEFAIDSIDVLSESQLQASILKRLLVGSEVDLSGTDKEASIGQMYATRLMDTILDPRNVYPVELQPSVAKRILDVQRLRLRVIRNIFEQGHIGTTLSSRTNKITDQLPGSGYKDADVVENLAKETIVKIIKEATPDSVSASGLNDSTRLMLAGDAINTIPGLSTASKREKKRAIKLLHQYLERVKAGYYYSM